MNNQSIMNRSFVMLGAVMIQLALGAIYAWPVFTPWLTEAGWTKSETQYVFSLGLASFAVCMVFAGRKLNVWGPRRLAVIGGLVLGSGYVLAGVTGGYNFAATLIFVGLIGGAGIGFAYVVPIAVGIQWFPDKKGMITGLAVAGFGFGALIWVKIAGSWVRLLEHIGVNNTLTVYGIAFAVMVVAGGIWMKFPPRNWKPNGVEAIAVVTGAKREKATSPKEFTCGEMLKTIQFYMIFLIFVFSAGAGLMSIGLMKLYPIEALTASGISESAASGIAGTAMAVFFSLANGLGRIIWGAISDRIGRKISIIFMTSIQGVVVIMFTVMAGSVVLLYLGAALIGFNFGGNFALFPTLTADIFGSRNVGQNYPFIFLAYGAGGILGPVLGGMLGDMGNFSLAFTLSGILVLAGTGLTFLLHPPASSSAGSAPAL